MEIGPKLVAQAVRNLPAVQETHVGSLGQEDPGGGLGNLLQYSLSPGESHGEESSRLQSMGTQIVGHD